VRFERTNLVQHLALGAIPIGGIVGRLESLFKALAKPEYLAVHPAEAPDLRHIIDVLTSHIQAEDVHPSTLLDWVADELAESDPNAKEVKAVRAKLRAYVNTSGKNKRDSMLTRQPDAPLGLALPAQGHYGQYMMPLQGVPGWHGGHGPVGGAHGGGWTPQPPGGGGTRDSCPKCFGTHMLAVCPQGIALCADGTENVTWRYSVTHPRREGVGMAPKGPPVGPRRPRRRGAGSGADIRLPALMPPQ